MLAKGKGGALRRATLANPNPPPHTCPTRAPHATPRRATPRAVCVSLTLGLRMAPGFLSYHSRTRPTLMRMTEAPACMAAMPWAAENTAPPAGGRPPARRAAGVLSYGGRGVWKGVWGRGCLVMHGWVCGRVWRGVRTWVSAHDLTLHPVRNRTGRKPAFLQPPPPTSASTGSSHSRWWRCPRPPESWLPAGHANNKIHHTRR